MQKLFTKKIKIIVVIFHILFICSLNAQYNKVGAIKTKNGVLIYNNADETPYTINFYGNIDFSRFPFVSIDGNMFQFNHNEASQFGTSEKDILVNNMNWELDYIKSSGKFKIDNVPSSFTISNGQLIHLWNYTNPLIKEGGKHDDKAYFASFVKNDRVYLVCYILYKGTEKEANSSLITIFNGIRFYYEEIDVQKLQERIRNKY